MKKKIISLCLLFLLLFSVNAYAAEPTAEPTGKPVKEESVQDEQSTQEASETESTDASLGSLHIRPDLPDRFRGTMELKVKNQETGKIYSCKIDKYNYPYSTWSPTFYWKTMSLPYGSYDIVSWVVMRDGKYLYTTVPSETIDVYPSWSGMFFPSVYDTEISEDEALGNISLDGEEYVTPSPEPEKKEEKNKKNNTFVTVQRVAFILAAAVCIVGMIVYFKKYKEYH